ncbi:MAG: Lrp/AsnC family transcriptional regulator [Proteobacteria bacterium]|nr:Lrp/AsnC family transcriptional regulator [Pseudomonadota bacterium]
MNAKEDKRQARRRSLDEVDRRILTLLQQNARMSNKELAQKVELSPTPCLRRVGLLEESGVLRRYRAVIDANHLGYTIRAFVTIKRTRESDRDGIWQQIARIPEVVACHVVSGEFDLLVELVARDMNHYGQLLLETINKIDGVYDSRSTFSIRALKMDGELPVSEA